MTVSDSREAKVSRFQDAVDDLRTFRVFSNTTISKG